MRSYLAWEIECVCATYQVSFSIFIEILTADIIFITKELLLAFSNQVLTQCALTVPYVMFPFVSSIVLFSSRKKWLSYLSHAISPYLHGKLISSTGAFYLSFCCTVLPRILNILIFMNRVISIICICQLYFRLFQM